MVEYTIEETVRWAIQYVSLLFLPESGFFYEGLDLTDQQKRDIERHIWLNQNMTREEHKKYLRAYAQKIKESKNMPPKRGKPGEIVPFKPRKNPRHKGQGSDGYTGFMENEGHIQKKPKPNPPMESPGTPVMDWWQDEPSRRPIPIWGDDRDPGGAFWNSGDEDEGGINWNADTTFPPGKHIN